MFLEIEVDQRGRGVVTTGRLGPAGGEGGAVELCLLRLQKDTIKG